MKSGKMTTKSPIVWFTAEDNLQRALTNLDLTEARRLRRDGADIQKIRRDEYTPIQLREFGLRPGIDAIPMEGQVGRMGFTVLTDEGVEKLKQITDPKELDKK
jgi:hypothetical protein